MGTAVLIFWVQLLLLPQTLGVNVENDFGVANMQAGIRVKWVQSSPLQIFCMLQPLFVNRNTHNRLGNQLQNNRHCLCAE